LGRDDWFRNASWDPEIEATFMARLRRARDKSQYLRIQASYLTGVAPEVALRLLAHYFQLGEHFDQAQAHVDRARAYITLGNLDAAIASYEAALERERVYPQLQTQAHLNFPLLIVMRRLPELYSRALAILDATQSRLMFPIDRYLAHGTRALILDEWGNREEARESAALALAAASETQSGFRYHQDIGLVPTANDDLASRLEAIAQTRH
jgi:tetratricopeptide (TPR) repeat protein